MAEPAIPGETPTGRFARADGWPLLVLLAAYLIPGTFQRGPWKNEDAAYFGVVWRALESGDWVHFALSASPMPGSPLYYWLSGVGVFFLQGWLPVAAAARAASTLFVVVALLACFLAARRLFDRPWAGVAPLTLIGSLGLLIASHDVQPLTAAMAGVAVLLYGLSLGRATAHFAAAPVAVATAVSALGIAGILLSTGLRLLPAVLLVLASGLAHDQRRRHGLIAAAALLLGSLPMFAWWRLLELREPALASAWLAVQWEWAAPADAARTLLTSVKTLSWWAWPAWPLALLAVWRHRQRLLSPALLAPLAMAIGLHAAIVAAGETRQAWLLAPLPAMALLGVPAFLSMRRSAQSLFDWFGRSVFALLLLLVVFGWTAMLWGWPVRWAARAARMAPGFVAEFDAVAAASTFVAIAIWIGTLAVSQRSPRKGLFSWSGGLVACWVAIVALWLPWFDHQRSYRPLTADIERALAGDRNCIDAEQFSEAQYAIFDYYLNNRLHRRAGPSGACPWRLVNEGNEGGMARGGFPPSWTSVWNGARPGDNSERFFLLRRQP